MATSADMPSYGKHKRRASCVSATCTATRPRVRLGMSSHFLQYLFAKDLGRGLPSKRSYLHKNIKNVAIGGNCPPQPDRFRADIAWSKLVINLAIPIEFVGYLPSLASERTLDLPRQFDPCTTPAGIWIKSHPVSREQARLHAFAGQSIRVLLILSFGISPPR